ncbi:twin-arginine translocation signal domain-containing protein [Gilvimarinus sp. F26214L]|uniref:twin-arginine translocation signal domain-containing protein n=1 Tax=Gilvimarinus sp. DZF01 TaxID=3461371 RepID=UPI004045FEC6
MDRRNFLKGMTASSAVLGLAAHMPVVLARSQGEYQRSGEYGLLLPQWLADTGGGRGIIEGARAAVPQLRLQPLPSLGELAAFCKRHSASSGERWTLVSSPADVEVFQACLRSIGGRMLARGEHVLGAAADRHQWLAATSRCSPARILAEHSDPAAELLVSERFVQYLPGSPVPVPGYTCWQSGDLELHGADITLSSALNLLPGIKGSRTRSYRVAHGPRPIRPVFSNSLNILGYALMGAAARTTPASAAKERFFLRRVIEASGREPPPVRQISSIIFET